MKPSLRAALNLIGAMLGAAALLYFGWELYGHGPELRALLLNQQAALTVASVTLVYAASLYLLAYAWATLALPAGGDASLLRMMRTYALSSLAKYLPGNVWHLAARHWSAQEPGISHGRIARATVTELVMSAAAAAAIGASVLWLPGGWGLPVSVLLGLGLLHGVARVLLGCGASTAFRASVACIGFFLAYAACIAACAWLMDLPMVGPWQVMGAGLLAWLAGFLVPGAPGGLGVREAALLWLLAGQMDASQAGSLAVTLRVATTFADGLFAVSSAWLLAERRFAGV